ncbi:MAG: hypothetical protein K2K81_06925 [Muribaculaceae bacterium]|nr:hypothetical protein [Muribaculaceae bacterium]
MTLNIGEDRNYNLPAKDSKIFVLKNSSQDKKSSIFSKLWDSIKYIGIVIILILFIFNIIPAFGPAKIGTREYISIIAIPYVFLLKKRLPKVIWILYLANWTQVFFSVFTILINDTLDLWYVQFAIRNILYLSGAILIADLSPLRIDINKFILGIIIAILINDIVAAYGFFNPSFMQQLVNLQQINEERANKTIEFAVRMIGLGYGSYFNGGVINGIGIILTVYLISKNSISLLYGSILIFFLFIIGLFIARTTIVGAGIAFIYFTTVLKPQKTIVVIFSIASLLILILSIGVFDNVNTDHAFEIFQGLDGLLNNRSMEEMSSMYEVEMSDKTIFIGDGLSKINGHYYMKTDVGWMRNILYFGIIGTIIGYVYYEAVLFYKWYRIAKFMLPLIIAFAIDLFILNFKGLADFNFMIFLIVAYVIKVNKHKHYTNENPTYHTLPRNWRSPKALD